MKRERAPLFVREMLEGEPQQLKDQLEPRWLPWIVVALFWGAWLLAMAL